MKQYVCDRCGAVIPSNKWFHNRILLYDGDVSYGKGIEFKGNRSYSEYDFCDDCLNTLNNLNQAFVDNEIIGTVHRRNEED